MLLQEQINLYIADHPAWQRKCMVRLRQLIHSAEPEVEEAWRGRMPHFDLHGHPVLSICASKTCVSITFQNGDRLGTSKLPFQPVADGRSARTLKLQEQDELNERAFCDLVKKAMALNGKESRAEAESKRQPEHADLETVLRKDPTAWANWGSFKAQDRKEYSEWVADGRDEETRKRRIAQALEMIREGVHKDEAVHRVKGA